MSFLDYSATYWVNHVRTAKNDTEMFDLALEICETQSTLFQTWHRVYWARTHLYSHPPNFTNLTVGSLFGLEGVVKLLLKTNADVNAKDDGGQTPLFWAAGNGHTVVVKLLLEKEADLNIKNSNGQTLLSMAKERGCNEVVKLLLEYSAHEDSES